MEAKEKKAFNEWLDHQPEYHKLQNRWKRVRVFRLKPMKVKIEKKKAKEPIPLPNIASMVDTFFSVSIRAKSRKRTILFPRTIYYFLARSQKDKFGKPAYSLQQIADIIGVDHGTVLNGLKNHEADVLGFAQYREMYLSFINNHKQFKDGQEK